MPEPRLLLLLLVGIGGQVCRVSGGEPVDAEERSAVPADPGELPEELLMRFPKQRPEDAVEFQGSHYRVFLDLERELTWHQKKALCERMGGHLAVIETPEEQAFIVDLADDRYLSLGATDEAEEGTWRWINGAEWKEPHWMEGQPNNYWGEEHYLATYDEGLWVDVAAQGLEFWLPVGFICEWPASRSDPESP